MDIIKQADDRLQELCDDYTFGKPADIDVIENANRVVQEFRDMGHSIKAVPVWHNDPIDVDELGLTDIKFVLEEV